jgi:uncharacterized protein (DUF433 family)
MMPRYWTDPILDDILSRVRTGERIADIADEYGMSGSALRNIIYRHRGSAVREARKDMYVNMAKLWDAGWTTVDIAHKYDMHPQTLAHIIARNRDLFPRKNRRRAK